MPQLNNKLDVLQAYPGKFACYVHRYAFLHLVDRFACYVYYVKHLSRPCENHYDYWPLTLARGKAVAVGLLYFVVCVCVGPQHMVLWTGVIARLQRNSTIFTVAYKNQCFGSVLIFSGSGSRGWGWRPIRIRIQSWSSALMTKNWKKWQLKKKLNFFLIKNCNLPTFLGLHKVCPSYRRSLQLIKEAIQHFKTWIFLFLWVIFALLDPDPDSEYRSGSIGPIEYGSNPDPDPKPWQKPRILYKKEF
jgi:hypothetical protein